MAKGPRSNWDRLMETEAGTPSFPHGELLDKGDNGTNSHNAELDAILRQRVPRARQRVAQTVVRRDAPEANRPKGMDIFKAIVERDAELLNAQTSLIMVCGLLRDSYKNQRAGESVLAAAGFEQANLHRLLGALFGSMKGGEFPQKRVVAYLTKANWTVNQIIYYDILGLRDDSDPEEIRAKCEEFKQKADRLDDLLAFPNVENVNQALRARKDPKNADVPTADLVKKWGVASATPIVFDEAGIARILEEVKLGHASTVASAPSPRTAPAVLNYDELYTEVENQPAGVLLRRLYDAFRADTATFGRDFQAQYFDGNDLTMVAVTLDNLFEPLGITVGLGSELVDVSLTGNVTALLQTIAKNFRINDLEALKQKLVEVYDRIKRKYPNLSAGTVPTPRRAASSALPAIDYEAFYDALAESTPVEAYAPFFHLFYALRRSDADYDTKDKNQLFEGESRATVMSDIDMAAGDGMGGILQEASRRAPDAEYLTALIQAIAEYFGLTEKPGDLKTKLVEIGIKLGKYYPKLKTL